MKVVHSVVIALYVFCVLLVPVCAAENFLASYQAGVAAYRKKDFKTATDLFWKSVRAGNPTPLPWLYAGHCYYALGDRRNSIHTYGVIVSRFKSSPEAAIAQRYLSLLNKDYSVAGQAKTKSDLLDSIEVLKSSGNHPAVSAETIAAVERAVGTIPTSYYRFLSDHGARIHIICNLVDKWPAALTSARPGVPGETLAACPGRTSGHDIWICERAVYENNDVKEAYSPDSIQKTTLHECGHAVDNLLGPYSKSPELKRAYADDVASIPESEKWRLEYFLQPGEGASEVCAESTAKLFGSSSSGDDMQKYFPKTFAAVKKKLHL